MPNNNKNLNYTKLNSSLFLIITYIIFTLIQEAKALNKKPSNSEANKISEIQYFIYLVPEKEIVLCSDKIFSESEINLIPNELKLDDKFTCMINLDQTKIYHRINLHILKTKNFKNYKKNLIDIYLGETLTIKNINILRVYGENKEHSYLRKQILVKFVDSKIYFLKNAYECKIENLDNCDFADAEDALFRKRNLMLNIKLKEPEVKEISLLEKMSNCYFIFKKYLIRYIKCTFKFIEIKIFKRKFIYVFKIKIFKSVKMFLIF
jgi:hypothetical protein